jgi:hypothetical protein
MVAGHTGRIRHRFIVGGVIDVLAISGLTQIAKVEEQPS